MLQCIAIDDEPLALALLEDYISKVPYLHLVAKCSDAFEATKVMQEHEIDLIFADIQMPGLTGIQFIQSLPTKPMVIFITAYEKFALDGYSLDVVDYLLKPVEMDRFVKACNKANELYQLKHASKPAAATASSAQPAPTYFFVNADYSLVKVQFNDITWIEGLRDYVKIHLKSTAKPLIVRSGIRAIEQELPASNFLRVHKSFIVSIDSITSIRKNSVFINEMEIPVGAVYREAIDKLTGKTGA
ncbi:two component transcriptional regulator, LytTR family [Filimonas lacunae]|uniref:Two component transcriptional regulator, LytTR family n=1 Tax=Filimonas lacunae TaxID=477680 RepID=A0A173MCB8_9BACT|nr:LytTR family DNA-binding domain-containing protein [Filimonas lacunae]BAV05195.1 two-component system response regulator [Filimonas lacunae]SIT22701.1 two component transcriptional regulator, LytTR family [Filimonas lacunae]